MSAGRVRPALATTGVDVEAVAARVRQWLAEGRDVRLSAVPAVCPGFPLIELWDADGVEVVTEAGAIAERRGRPVAAISVMPRKRRPTPRVRRRQAVLNRTRNSRV